MASRSGVGAGRASRPGSLSCHTCSASIRKPTSTSPKWTTSAFKSSSRGIDGKDSDATLDVLLHDVDGDFLVVGQVRVQVADRDQAEEMFVLVDDGQVADAACHHHAAGL